MTFGQIEEISVILLVNGVIECSMFDHLAQAQFQKNFIANTNTSLLEIIWECYWPNVVFSIFKMMWGVLY